MKYLRFKIYNYRAIESAEIAVSNSLIPIIGINESGKTTILLAVLAFDKNKDKYNKGEHLEYKNKYKVSTETQEAKWRSIASTCHLCPAVIGPTSSISFLLTTIASSPLLFYSLLYR